MSKVVLVTAQPRNPATGVASIVRLAGGGNRKGYFYGGQHFRAGLAALPRFKAEIGFDENGWSGSASPTTAGIGWAPASSAGLAGLAAHYWRGAAVTIEVGDEETGAFATRLVGRIADGAVQDHKLALTFADPTVGLDRPLLTARFAGTGGAEGGAEAKGRLKRRTWGRAFNVEGRILDKANNIYEFGDPAFPWQAIDKLRDKGREAAPAPAAVAWQGSVAATLAALAATAPVQGSGVVAPSIACAKWWTQASGPLTADVRGEIGAGYVETAPHIAERILAAAAGPGLTNAAAASAWRPYATGLHVGDEETIAAALDRLLYGVSLLWIFASAGTVTLREISFADPVETLVSDVAERRKTFKPVKSRRLGYQRAHRSHSDGEIAASLLQMDPDAGTKLGELTVLVAQGNAAVTTSSVQKTGGANNAYNAGAKTSLSYRSPIISGRANETNAYHYMGLTQAPDAGFGRDTADFIVEWRTGPVELLVYRANVVVAAIARTGSERFSAGYLRSGRFFVLKHDGADVTVVYDDPAAPANLILYGVARQFTTGARVVDLVYEATAEEAYKTAKGELSATVKKTISGPPTSSVTAKSDGTFDAGILPKVVSFTLVNDLGQDITAAAAFAATLKSGSAAFAAALTIANGRAQLSVSGLDVTSTFEIGASIGGVVVDRVQHVMEKVQPNGASGSTGTGGTSASAAISGSYSSSVYGAYLTSDWIRAKAGSNGRVDCTLPYQFVCVDNVNASNLHSFVKWHWRPIGGAAADIAAEIQSTLPASVTSEGGGIYTREPGSGGCTAAKTGLTPGTEYEFRPYARSGTSGRLLSWSGQGGASAQCVGS
jgi:hypothetical protein